MRAKNMNNESSSNFSFILYVLVHYLYSKHIQPCHHLGIEEVVHIQHVKPAVREEVDGRF
jgi:hypothetical protein